MRAVTFVLSQPPGSHPAQLVEQSSAFTRERIYHLNLMADGTLVLLGEVRGDLDLLTAILPEREAIRDFSVSAKDDGRGLVYIHADPPTAIGEFLALQRTHEVFFDFPVEGTRDGRFRVTMVGETNAVLQGALAAVPPELDVSVERIGPYREDASDVTALLTDRQREVLDVARDLGYYRAPRQATHQDIADRLDLSVGTVTEHLQKIEARVFGAE